MADIVVQVEGLEKMLRSLNELGGLKVVRATMNGAALYIKGKIAKYPPASEANTPNQRRWYERGWGAKWTRKDGSINGRKSSQTLGRRWTTELTDGGYGAKVGNNATYAKYVQDRDSQTYFHEARGWLTAQDVSEQEADKVRDLFASAIQAEIRRLGLS
jgi:hypothetical protein